MRVEFVLNDSLRRKTKTMAGRARTNQRTSKESQVPTVHDRAAALRLAPVSRETEARLDQFVTLFLTWQAKINLVAPSSLSRLWTRHIADSLQLLSLAPNALTWIDLGTGGGFPGVVLACALADRPGACVHLIDNNVRRAAFLREVIRALKISAIVHCERIEEFISHGAKPPDVITARALAPLDRLAGLIHPLLKKGGQALLLKGQDVDVELTEASKCWNIVADLVPSKTHRDGQILVVRALAPR